MFGFVKVLQKKRKRLLFRRVKKAFYPFFAFIRIQLFVTIPNNNFLMKLILPIVSLLLLLTTQTQAQIQQQIGLEVGVGINKIHYTLDPTIQFIKAPDLYSSFTPGLMASLKYDLTIAQHLHLGLGLGVEMKESGDNQNRSFERNQVETTNLILPIELGYRSALIGKMYLTADALIIPHATVRNARVIYYQQGNGQESYYLPVEHQPFNVQVGAKLGAGWALSERLDFQLSLLGRVDLWKYEPEGSSFHERYWGLQLNAGLKWSL